MELKYLKASVEAVLFACADPVSAAYLAEVLEAPEEDVCRALLCIGDDCSRDDRGVTLLHLEDRWQLATKNEFADEVRRALDKRRNAPLSPAALEVLAIIAYNQPVSRSFIEQVRGVDSSSTVQTLIQKGLIEEAGIDKETEQQLRERIENKNYFGVEELTDNEALIQLPKLFGSGDILARAEELTGNPRALSAIKRLKELYDILGAYGLQKYVTFDLGMTVHYGYYTGIIFRGYTYGTGDAIVKGGRYDHLLEKFGKNSPSIGFAIVIDELMNAMTRQKLRIVYTRKNNLILYDEGKEQAAIALARDFRHKAKNTELLRKEKNRLLEEYVAYGREYYAGNLIYIRKSGEILMVNLVSGEQKVIENKRTEQDL